MKEIPLYHKGNVVAYAKVDDQDFEHFSQWKWRVLRHGRKPPHYAIRVDSDTRSTILLHREIMGAKTGDLVDHINHDGLDCQRANMRFCTHAQNMMNRRFTRKQATGERWIERSGKRFAVVIVVYKERHRASFSTLADAVLWRDAKIAALHGEFACFG